MLDLCARHGIVANVEMIRIQDIGQVHDRMQLGDIERRFVIDNATLNA